MKSKKEILMGKRSVLVDRSNNALNRKNYKRFTELTKEIYDLTLQLGKLDENK